MKKITLIIFLIVIIFSCKKTNSDYKKLNTTAKPNIVVTFIELGSVNCVPCKMMQPVMKQIEEEYQNQVKVIFYDIWTDKDSPMAEKYKIRVIPTQIFLDKDNKEFFRHEGYFPFDDIVKIFNAQGIK